MNVAILPPWLAMPPTGHFGWGLSSDGRHWRFRKPSSQFEKNPDHLSGDNLNCRRRAKPRQTLSRCRLLEEMHQRDAIGGRADAVRCCGIRLQPPPAGDRTAGDRTAGDRTAGDRTA